MLIEKRNVSEFNGDVRSNDGYLYTTNPPLSSILANRRISDSIFTLIGHADPIIDVGCGDGVYTAEIKKAFPYRKVEGLDPAADAIAVAKKRYPDILFRVDNILNPETAGTGSSYQTAIIRGVLHHLTDQTLAIRNSFALAPRLIIVEPNGNNPILKIIEKISPYHRKHEERSFSSRTLRGFCEKAGGSVIRLGYIGFVPYFMPAPLAKILHFFQPLLEKMPLIREFFSAQIVMECEKKIEDR
jgi:SAM-dependent methyltransferase